MSYPLVPRTWI